MRLLDMVSMGYVKNEMFQKLEEENYIKIFLNSAKIVISQEKSISTIGCDIIKNLLWAYQHLAVGIFFGRVHFVICSGLVNI